MDDVDVASPLISLLKEEKKSLPVPPWATSELLGGCRGIGCGGGEYCCWSPFISPFFVAASFAVFVKSPIVDLPTYVKSSIVFLLTPAACLDACSACFDASSAAFFA